MSETAITVTDAARDFLRLIEQLEKTHESAVLVRDGQPVARLVPCSKPASSCEELAERWSLQDRLSAEEADAFADDLEKARRDLPSLKPAWG